MIVVLLFSQKQIQILSLIKTNQIWSFFFANTKRLFLVMQLPTFSSSLHGGAVLCKFQLPISGEHLQGSHMLTRVSLLSICHPQDGAAVEEKMPREISRTFRGKEEGERENGGKFE